MNLAKMMQAIPEMNAVRSAFELMEIAEEEILAACRANRDRALRIAIWNSFGAMNPGALSTYAPAVYRHHVRELLARVLAKTSLEPGTTAEVLAMLSATSLNAPLLHDYGQIALQLAAEMFPGKSEFRGAKHDPARVTLDELRKKASVPGRAVRSPLRPLPDHFLKQLASKKRTRS